jgi:hypothetical protein
MMCRLKMPSPPDLVLANIDVNGVFLRPEEGMLVKVVAAEDIRKVWRWSGEDLGLQARCTLEIRMV